MQKTISTRLAELDPAELAYRALVVYGAVAAVVTAVAVVESYSNLHAFAQAYGLHGWRAAIAPAAADSFIVMGELMLFAAYLLGWTGWTLYALGYGMTAWGFAVSLGGNVWHAPAASPIDKALGAIWPVTATAGLAGCLIIVRRLLASRKPQSVITWPVPLDQIGPSMQLTIDETAVIGPKRGFPEPETFRSAGIMRAGEGVTPPSSVFPDDLPEPESEPEPRPRETAEDGEGPQAAVVSPDAPGATPGVLADRAARAAGLTAAPPSGRTIDPARAELEAAIVLDLMARPSSEWPTVNVLAVDRLGGSLRSAQRVMRKVRASSNGNHHGTGSSA